MACYRWSPAFRIEPIVSASSAPEVRLVNIQPGAGNLPAATYNYRVWGTRGGTGRWPSLQRVIPAQTTTSTGAIIVSVYRRPEFNQYWFFRDQPSSGSFQLAGVSDGHIYVDPANNREYMRFVDHGEWPLPGIAQGTALTIGGGDDVVEIPMNVALDSSAPLVVSVDDVTYDDRGEAEDEDVNGRLVARELGVRSKVDLSIRVRAGSEDEDKILQIYSAKLAHPTMRLLFTLNYDWSSTTWRECRLIGDYTRTPLGGVQDYVQLSWSVIMRRPVTVPPAMQFTGGEGFW